MRATATIRPHNAGRIGAKGNAVSQILIGKSEQPVYLLAKYANRHGMIAGATGTGKSVSLTVLAEGFSKLGVPVFLADVKGDLAGMAIAGTMNDKLKARIDKLGIEWSASANPVVFWDIYGKAGHPVRTTISEMGPTLLGRLMELNDTQQGVLEIVFKAADDNGLLLLDIKDLRALLAWAVDNAKDISQHYGLVAPTSIAAIQRGVLTLEQNGGEQFFGEPALDLADFMRQDLSGRGIVNVLAADQLILKPKLYTTFLLWMLSELFEKLPEVGDLDQPKLVFFFDEAHLLFDEAPPALRQRVAQTVRLIRSKGVGVFFVTQLPDDVSDEILAQLGNRIQHALRAFTPRDAKALKAAVTTYPDTDDYDLEEALTQLGTGEAMVTILSERGAPTPVVWTKLRPPRSLMAAIATDELTAASQGSDLWAKYAEEV